MPMKSRDFFIQERSDLSNFLIHLTKIGSFEEYTPFEKCPGHYLFKSNTDGVEPEDSLRSILGSNPPTLLARSPFGHFKFGIPAGYQKRKGIPLEWLQCVCFSEAPLRELRSFYQATQKNDLAKLKANKYQKFGLAFHTEFVRKRGGHPLFYFDSNRKDVIEAIDALATPNMLATTKHILPLCESFGPKLHSPSDQGEIDFRWEREWRFVGSFQFKHSEVAFGLCPEEKIPEYDKLVNDTFPFIDPDWETEKLQEYLTSKGHSTLADAL